MKMTFLFFVLVCIMSMSCRSSSEKRILSIDSMKFVMWDMMKSDELYMRILGKDSTARLRNENIRLYEEVLVLHKTTKGQFDSSYKYYAAHPIQFKLLLDSLEAFSAREKIRLYDPKQGTH
ncbi:MAG: DUF4296 domain-containing protein [Bacteroidota bacterium]